MSQTGKDYNLEVVTTHTVTIRWMWQEGFGNELVFTEQFHDKLDNYWLFIRDDFRSVRNQMDRYPFGLRDHGRFKLAGNNAEEVLAAAKEMAKKIFYHQFVYPMS
jgi:hypothetical protein